GPRHLRQALPAPCQRRRCPHRRRRTAHRQHPQVPAQAAEPRGLQGDVHRRPVEPASSRVPRWRVRLVPPERRIPAVDTMDELRARPRGTAPRPAADLGPDWAAPLMRSRVAVIAIEALVLLALPTVAGAASITSDVEVHAPRGGEPQLAVNPRNPQNLVMGENVDGVAVSYDGGASWTQVPLPNMGDNALAVEPDGTFLFTSIDGTVWSSKTGGLTWEDAGNWVGAVAETGYSLLPKTDYPVNVAGGDVIREVACNTPDIEGAGPVTTEPPPAGPGVQTIGCDRPWLVTDPQTGRAYLSFSVHEDAAGGTWSSLPWELGFAACRANVTSLPIFRCGRQYVAASRNGGHTWTKFKPMDSSDYPAAVTMGWSGGPVASFGRLATAYVANGRDCGLCVVFETSTDAGATWERHIVAPVELPANTAPTCAVFGCGDGSLNTSFNFEPYTAADPTRRGRYAVMVFDRSQTRLIVYVTDDY